MFLLKDNEGLMGDNVLNLIDPAFVKEKGSVTVLHSFGIQSAVESDSPRLSSLMGVRSNGEAFELTITIQSVQDDLITSRLTPSNVNGENGDGIENGVENVNGIENGIENGVNENNDGKDDVERIGKLIRRVIISRNQSIEFLLFLLLLRRHLHQEHEQILIHQQPISFHILLWKLQL